MYLHSVVRVLCVCTFVTASCLHESVLIHAHFLLATKDRK